MKILVPTLRRVALGISFVLLFALLNYLGWCVLELSGIHDSLLKGLVPYKFFPFAVVTWFALLFFWLWYAGTVRGGDRVSMHGAPSNL